MRKHFHGSDSKIPERGTQAYEEFKQNEAKCIITKYDGKVAKKVDKRKSIKNKKSILAEKGGKGGLKQDKMKSRKNRQSIIANKVI